MKLRSGGESTNEAAVQALLEEMDEIASHLEIRPSLIPGGGDGLFTTIDLPADKPIVLYHGVLTPKHLGRYCIRGR